MIRALVEASKIEAVSKFSGKEYLYLDKFRVELFKVCFGLDSQRRKNLMVSEGRERLRY